LRGMISRFCCAAQRKYDSGQQCAGGLGQVQSDRSGLGRVISVHQVLSPRTWIVLAINPESEHV